MKFFLTALLAITSTCAMAAIANFTGKMEPVITVTGQSAYKCEYIYAGTRFWRIFKDYCPATVDIE